MYANVYANVNVDRKSEVGILKLKILSTKVRENYRIFCADFILMIGVCEI